MANHKIAVVTPGGAGSVTVRQQRLDRPDIKTNAIKQGKLVTWSETMVVLDTGRQIVTYDADLRQIASEWKPAPPPSLPPIPARVSPAPPPPPSPSTRSFETPRVNSFINRSAESTPEKNYTSTSDDRLLYNTSNRRSRWPIVLLLLAGVGYWQRERIIPLVHDLTNHVSALDVEHRTADRGNIAHVTAKPEKGVIPPKPEKPSSQGVAITAVENAISSRPSFESFSSIPAVADALSKALKTGNAKKWKEDGRKGYAIVSETVNQNGKDCRSAYISEHIDGQDQISTTKTYCKSDGDWIAL